MMTKSRTMIKANQEASQIKVKVEQILKSPVVRALFSDNGGFYTKVFLLDHF